MKFIWHPSYMCIPLLREFSICFCREKCAWVYLSGSGVEAKGSRLVSVGPIDNPTAWGSVLVRRDCVFILCDAVCVFINTFGNGDKGKVAQMKSQLR